VVVLTKNTILEVINLKKYFPITSGVLSKVVGWIRAVDNVSFKIEEGLTYALVGESGCGKTTLGRTIVGIYEPTDGNIIFRGVDLTKLKDKKELLKYRRKLAIVFQDPTSSLNPRRRIIDIVTAPLEIYKLNKGKSKPEVAGELMRLVELDEHFIYRYPHELSGGQRQRVAIARALASEPELIVLDEPTSALDVSVQAKILQLLKRLQQQFNLTYLLITHDLSVVKYMADQVAVMYAGKMVEEASKEELYNNPMHPYTRALFSAIPVILPEELQFLSKFMIPPPGGEPPKLSDPPPGCRFHPRCPQAIKGKCDVEEPPLIEMKPGHRVACHLYA